MSVSTMPESGCNESNVLSRKIDVVSLATSLYKARVGIVVGGWGTFLGVNA